MKNLKTLSIMIMLIGAMPCAARQTYEEKRSNVFRQREENRKADERRRAAKMVANAKARTARHKAERIRTQEQEIQTALDIEAQINNKNLYRDEVSHFTQLVQEISTHKYTDRPMLDIINEAESRLENIAVYNPKMLKKYQGRLEAAVGKRKHSFQ